MDPNAERQRQLVDECFNKINKEKPQGSRVKQKQEPMSKEKKQKVRESSWLGGV